MKEKIKWMAILVFLMGIIYGGHKLSMVVATVALPEAKTVVIDAGHGGADPGKIGINNALEKDINLQIAKNVEEILTGAGVHVVMTRKGEDGVSENKKEDMRKRVEIIDQADAEIAVSIHQNSYSSEAEKGAQVFYYGQSEEGMRAAEIIQNHLKLLDPENRRQIKENDSYYILKNTKTPTVIVECGFLSNWEEAKKLTQESYQRDIAEVISEAILVYIRQE